jgi:recA bacterial DNA recombination protein
MTQANLRLVERTFMDKAKALDAALSQIERAFGKSSIIRLGNESTGHAMIEAIEPEAELFALAEQVDLAEKAFHDALARRNEAQIAYLREPSIMTRKAFEAAKTAEAVALEILDTELRWLARTRATTVIGLKLKASYASTEGKLADSIVEDILQL